MGLLLFCACERPTSGPTPNPADYRDSTIIEYHGLGWLGATAHPLNQKLSFPDPGNSTATVSPGGIVLVEVFASLPIDAARLKPGDVVVRVDSAWLPIKEDPTLDFIKAIEDQINSKKDRVEIGFYRDGSFETTELKTELKSLDEGLPLPVERFTNSALAALSQLATLQLDDGSFAVDSDDPDGKLAATSMAGLAFLASENSATGSFAEHLAACLQFVGQRIDQRQQAERVRLLDPLTASRIAVFVAESDVDLGDIEWLERFGFLLQSLVSSQDQSGGWSVAGVGSDHVDETGGPDESDQSVGFDRSVDRQCDVVGTYTTLQVLLALGALERRGFSTDNQAIENGMAWLRDQTRRRIPSPIDRRVKSLLAAGTAAALTACNCDRNDVHLNELLTDAIERAHDVFSAPQLGLSGLLLTALAARQSGNEFWLRFHDSIKHLMVVLQNPDGSFHPHPGIKRQPLEFEDQVAGQAWETAHLALVLSMQSKQLKRLLAIEEPEAMVLRDSSGKVSTGVASLTDEDAEARKREAAELTKMIMEQLRDQGVDVDASELKIESVKKPDDE